MHKPFERRVEEAIEEAKKLLKPLVAPTRSWAIVSWTDPEPRHSPKDEFYAAVGFIHCLLDPDPEKSGEDRQAADNFLGAFAPIVREVILPALCKGLPAPQPTKGRPSGSFMLRDRRIVTVVEHIHQKYGFDRTRNPAEQEKDFPRPSACSIVAEALKKLGVERLKESHVNAIWTHRYDLIANK
jgi:hypothetical protein